MSDPAARELTTDDELATLLAGVRRVAVLGAQPASKADRAAHYVPAYLAAAGIDVIPVATYDVGVPEIFGHAVRRTVSEAGAVDLVDVFRKASDLPGHLDDLLAARPRAVWLQSGIRDDALAARLIAAGISVVQDRCLMVEHRRLARGG